MTCFRCDDTRWVCEAHPDQPWLGARVCYCGAPGDPCLDCNTTKPPSMPSGFKIALNKNGRRH